VIGKQSHAIIFKEAITLKDRTAYAEIAIYSSIVLLLIALSVCGYHDGQESKANVGIMPDVMGIAVDYWASEPTEVQPPLFGNIVSGIPYRARITNISMLRYPLPGEGMERIADIRCINRRSQEGYTRKVAYGKGGTIYMGTWLFWPKKKTPVSTEHDLLLMGATNPAACNGYYDEAGTYNGHTYYKHSTEDYYICWRTDRAWSVVGGSPSTEDDEIFWQNDGVLTGIYDNYSGVGTVVVYPVSVTLSGATVPAACNGEYVEAGTDEGRPYYRHETGAYYIQYDSGFWTISAEAPPISTMNYFFKDGGDTPVGAYDIDQGSGAVTVSMS